MITSLHDLTSINDLSDDLELLFGDLSMKSRADTMLYVRRERAQLEYIDTSSAERDSNTGHSEDDVEQDREAGSTEPGGTVSPGRAAVVVGAAVVSGTGLVVEAVATQ